MNHGPVRRVVDRNRCTAAAQNENMDFALRAAAFVLQRLRRASGPNIVQRRLWVAKGQTSIRFHRRKAASEIPFPGSGHSSASAPDPLRSPSVAGSGRSAEIAASDSDVRQSLKIL